MKPQILFTIIAALLVGGTVFSRLADAGQLPVASPAILNGANKVVIYRIAGETAFGAGELPALRRIARSLKNAPATAVVVEWTESYHQHRIARRACYYPQEQTLACSSGSRDSYSYQPVSRAGIDASLRDDNDAPFANANLYSLPHTPQP